MLKKLVGGYLENRFDNADLDCIPIRAKIIKMCNCKAQ